MSTIKCAPRLEALEHRWCPSASAVVQGDTLIIRADNNDNVVEIIDDGAGEIRVIVDGVALQNQQNQSASASASHSQSNSHDGGQVGDPSAGDFFTGIDRVLVQTLNGNDQVTYTLTGELTSSRQLDLDLGRGNDSAVFDFAAGVASPRLDVNLWGRDGNDAVVAVFGAVTDTAVFFNADLGKGNDGATLTLADDLFGEAALHFNARGRDGNDVFNVAANAQVDIDAQALLYLNLLGDTGRDTINVDYQGALNGDLLLNAAGGKDNDTVAVNLDLDAGSEGFVAARVRGDHGNDKLTLNILTADDLAVLVGLLDGGAGTDTCTATANVIVKRCEHSA